MEDHARPVAWILVEAGWRVAARGGEEVGAVERVLGNEKHDIFTGIEFASGVFGSSHFVEADRVRGIFEDRVEIDVEPDAVSELPPFDGPGT